MENKKKTNKEKIKDIYVGSITIPPQNGVSNGYAGDKPIYTLQGDAANRYFKALIQEREREAFDKGYQKGYHDSHDNEDVLEVQRREKGK